MPRPQAGTPTDVALADVDTGIRLGIEWHSVLTPGRSVKHPSGEDLVPTPCPTGRGRLVFRPRCRARVEIRSAFLPRSLRSPFSARLASRHPPPAAAGLAQQKAGGSLRPSEVKGARHLRRPAAASVRPTARARCVRHRPRRGRPRPPVARRARSCARRACGGRASRCVGRGRRHRRRRRRSPPADGHDERLARRGPRDVLPPRGLAAGAGRGCLPRGGPRTSWLEDRAHTQRGDRRHRACFAAAHRPARARSIRAPGRRATRVSGTAAGGARRGRLRRLALVPHGHLQGSLRRRPARALLPRPRGSRASRSRSRSSTSASRRTRSRVGSGPSRSGSSATTARSTRSTGTSRGWKPGSDRRNPSRASRPRSTSTDPTRRSSTTHSTSSCAVSDKDLAEAVSLLVPPAWQNDPRLDPEVRDFHRYGAMLSEPWDGPAALCFTDGRTCGATLDRNGLRPLRVAITDDGLVTVASEAGAVPLPEGSRVRRARLGPGGILVVDPVHGLLLGDELRARARAAASVRRLGARRTPSPPTSASPVEAPEDGLDARQVLHGYTREDLNTMLRPLAQTGHDPVSSMGDDALDRAARRPRAPGLHLPPTALRAGDEPRDRPPPRAPRHVGGDAARAARRRARRSTARRHGSPCSPGSSSTRPGSSRCRPFGSMRRSRVRKGSGEPLDRIVVLAESAAAAGAELLCLSDRDAGGERAPVPALLALSAVHTRLVDSGAAHALLASRRVGRAARHAHDRVPASATAPTLVCPRLALETVARSPRTTGSAATARRRPRRSAASSRAFEEGVLKVMSKMGIADVASYRGARLFDAVGLDRTLCREYLGGTPSALGGARLDRFEREALERLRGLSRGEAAAREPRLLQVPQGRRAARDRSRRRRCAAGGRRGCARAADSDARRPLRPVRPLRRARERPRPARASRPARPRPGRRRPSRSTRSSRLRRSSAASRAERCRTARSRRRRTRRSRSRSTASEDARTPARAARTRSASATSATGRSSRSRPAASA